MSLDTDTDVRVSHEVLRNGEPESLSSFSQFRDVLLPLPTRDDGYQTVLLLGTTGAGKTTVVRQLLGTKPKTERFPSTSTAKTTVADTEIITTDNDAFSSVVTFIPRDEVAELLRENACAAALAAVSGRDDNDLTRRLLDHVNQRFRFSYVLGRPPATDDDDLLDDDIEDEEEIDPDDYGFVDIRESMNVVSSAVRSLRSISADCEKEMRAHFVGFSDDPAELDDYIEENLDSYVREHNDFENIIEILIAQLEKRFDSIPVGYIRRGDDGWPITWFWETKDRADFLQKVTRFSSNHALLFGRLLTPLVNGIRVGGPFKSDWYPESLRLVLIDGEGLGHTPSSIGSLSTSTARLLDEVDRVLLVDNAKQPMQAAPVAALKEMAISGNVSKLHVVFTHFDQVRGANLRTVRDSENHVWASVENVLDSIGAELGNSARRALDDQMREHRYFVGGIDKVLRSNGRKLDIRTIGQFSSLLDELSRWGESCEGLDGVPTYKRSNLEVAIKLAAEEFHRKWKSCFGLEPLPQYPPVRWTRIKALSRTLKVGRTNTAISSR
ncbi:hypothetical protein FOS14_00120 [Skermania sp. ID1734]|uniref:hypothetical protein n=1 Tax=Skermania sp. ID1734 TaxID=2597516 RepID=UPI00117FC34A|nr:hypothetical protein [Skermania sp. ID1734]TSE01843.1 hypothetical protein FOS14_00120 [Skermania sp. ID1734]